MKPQQIENIVYEAVLLGDLEIDSQGRVWRLGSRHGSGVGQTIFVPCARRRAESPMAGYLAVRAMFDLVRYQAQAHRLVYRHFHGEIPDDLTINHENGNRLDNHPRNLTLATMSEQALHACYVLGTSRAAQGMRRRLEMEARK